MGYIQTSTKGKNEATNLESSQKNIGSLTFDLIWSGSAATSLISSLSNITNKLNMERAKLDGFFQALDLLGKYKQNKEAIARLKFQLMCIPDTEKNSGERAALQAQINQLEQENQALRGQIEGILSQITPVGSETNLVAHNVEFNYATGVDELLALYDHRLTEAEKAAGIGILRQLKGGTRLDSYYDQVDENGNVIKGSGYQYITGILNTVKNTYTGREAAVNTALVLLKLASDKGLKLDYKHQGTNQNPYVSTAYVMNGVDCNPWTAYCVDKGTPTRFQWRPVTGFLSVGTGIPYENWSQAQPGDVMVNQGHVGIIIENDPANNRFVVAEAKGQDVGIVLNYRTYSNLRGGGYSIRDMTNVYNGTENTDRACFEDRKESYKTTL